MAKYLWHDAHTKFRLTPSIGPEVTTGRGGAGRIHTEGNLM